MYLNVLKPSWQLQFPKQIKTCKLQQKDARLPKRSSKQQQAAAAESGFKRNILFYFSFALLHNVLVVPTVGKVIGQVFHIGLS